MSREDKQRARDDYALVQQAITKGWKAVAEQYPLLIEDFVQFTQGLAAQYRYWANEQEMEGVPIDDHKVSQLLQQARTCDTVRTYITSRIDSDVAQPIKKSK